MAVLSILDVAADVVANYYYDDYDCVPRLHPHHQNPRHCDRLVVSHVYELFAVDSNYYYCYCWCCGVIGDSALMMIANVDVDGDDENDGRDEREIEDMMTEKSTRMMMNCYCCCCSLLSLLHS